MTDIIAIGTDANKNTTINATSWRNVVKIHPAAEAFPRLLDGELRELADDIKKNGQRVPVVLFHADVNSEELLDGRSRLDAMELAGLPIIKDGALDRDVVLVEDIQGHGNPYGYVASVNIHRRHLSAEKKRELISTLLKAKPEQSNRAIAKQAKVDHKTVGAIRAEMESTGEIPQLQKTAGVDGRSRSTTRKTKNGTSQVPADGAVPADGGAVEHQGDEVTDPASPASETIHPTDGAIAPAASADPAGSRPADVGAPEHDYDLDDADGEHDHSDDHDAVAVPAPEPATAAKSDKPEETLIEHWRRCPGELGGLLETAGLAVILGAMSSDLNAQLQARTKQPINFVLKLRELDLGAAAHLMLDAFGNRFELVVAKTRELRAPKGRKAGTITKMRSLPTVRP